MRYLSLVEVLELHEAVIEFSGGARGIRDMGALEAAIEEQERIILDLAAGKLSRNEFTSWLKDHVIQINEP